MNRFVYTTSSLIALCAASGAAAQSAPSASAPAPSASSSVLGEIVVTAQRREERLQDVPVAVSVTKGSDLAKANINTVQDFATRQPAVKITTSDLSGSLINIRGVGSGANSGFEQAVGIFVDGVYRARSRNTQAAFLDLDRMEVLKGPQSLYFGNNTIAGALSMTTVKPGNQFAANGTVSYGTANEYDAEGGVTLPLSDSLSVRVAGKAYGIDGYVHNDALHRDEPRNRTELGRIAVAWTPTDSWRTDFRFDRGQVKTRGDGAQLIGCPPDAVYGPPAGYCAAYLAANGGHVDDVLNYHSANTSSAFSNYDYTELALTNRLEVAGYTITAITSYFDHHFSAESTIEPIPLPSVAGNFSTPAAFGDYEQYKDFSQEIRVESPKENTLSYMVGAYYSHGQHRESQYLGFYFGPFGLFAPPFDASTPVAAYVPYEQRDTTGSGFGALTWKVTDALKVNVGLRYTWVTQTAHAFTVFGTGGVPVNGGTFVTGPSSMQAPLAAFFGDLTDYIDQTRTDSKTTPSANIQYNFNHNTMVYASYTTGFKAGGFGVSPTRTSWGPETAKSFEVGAKATILNGRMFVSAALYDSKFKDLQQATQVPNPITGLPLATVQNVGRAESKGVELSTIWRVNDYLSMSADVAYNDAKTTSYPNAPCTMLQTVQAAPGACFSQDLSGQVKAFAPKWSGNLSATLQYPVSDDLLVKFQPSMYFTSKYFEQATLDPTTRQSNYVKFDARLSVGPPNGRWEAALIGKNLGDKVTAGYRSAGAVIQNGTSLAYVDPPRTVTVQFSYRY